MKAILNYFILTVCLVLCAGVSLAQTKQRPRSKSTQPIAAGNTSQTGSPSGAKESTNPTGKRLNFIDGGFLIVDDAWRQGSEVWYRRGNVTQSSTREVRSIEPVFAPNTDRVVSPPSVLEPSKAAPAATWIHLVGGARFKVDQVMRTSAGTWYSRGNISAFLATERIARIEIGEPGSHSPRNRNFDWTSGDPGIDALIKSNGTRYGVDPYLVFLVIEQESHFRSRAVSPKGARGLMQLMPGTARRFGVRRSFDAAENIRGGTQYLRELMNLFAGNVNLVLASYNAGEGAVMKYGRNVPPYRETREYVKRIGKRYGLGSRQTVAEDAPRN